LYTIGQQGVLTSKFNIYFNGNERSGVTSGLKVNLITRTGATSEHYGLDVNVTPENGQSASDAYGVKALVTDPGGVNTFGTWGKVVKSNSGPITNMHGALGWVEVSGGATGSTVYGNYGYSRLVGSIFTNVFGGYAKALVDGSSTVGNSFGVDASSSVTSGSTVTNSFGLRASSSTLSGGSITSISYGVKASGSDGVYQSFGLMAEASGIQGTKFGAYGKAGGAGTNYSVYGASPGNNATDWAGYFPGRTFTPGGLWTSSDESLKAGIEPIQSAVEMILALRPRTYTFQTDVYPSLGLPTGRQYGFLAGELQEQFPEMVIETIHPAQRDSVGNIVHDAVQFSAVNTTGIMPILVAAFREQHLHHAEISDQVNSELDLLRIQVQEQRERIDHLEQALAACCANPDGSRMLDQGLNQPNDLDGSFNGSDKLRIQPNPFNERTTVFYTLDRGGRTQLLANSSDGRDLRVLQEADLEAGSYQYDWNTAALAPGMYYVTLLLDGQPVVKKAVKVDR